MTANKTAFATLASVDGASSAGMALFTFCRAAGWSNLGIQSRGDSHPWEEKVCPSGGLEKIGILHTERVTSVS